jgi:hypothetical protein
MAWERRHNQAYYYRSKKVHGQVVHEYIGTGPQAELAALEDCQRKTKRDSDRQARRASQTGRKAADATLATLETLTNQILGATLTAAGYHQHDHGPWRKRRHGRASTHPEPAR